MNKKLKSFIPLAVLLILAYIILSARPLGKELHFVPQWTIDISRPTKASPETDHLFDDAIPFKLGQMLGYFTEEGKVLFSSSFDYKATVGSACYAPYSTHSENIAVYSPKGSRIAEIAHTGFPFFTDDGMYLFLPGGSSFSRVGDDGAVLWTYESYAPVTAFATSPAGCAAGFADGTVLSFTNDGVIDQQFAPTGSKYPVILGIAMSASGSMIACVAGQDRQRFVLAKKAGTHTEIIYHEYLKHEVTRQVPVLFSGDEKTVYYHEADGLGVVRTGSHKSSHIALPGKILSLEEAYPGGNVYAFSRSGDDCTISVIQPFDTHAGSFTFSAASAFMAVKGDALFIGRDSSISRLDIIVK
ncbi:MAG: hypothetical protein K6G80_02400 [Treponema sp.]|nr:hypothetical protein [Treponema sp.]